MKLILEGIGTKPRNFECVVTDNESGLVFGPNDRPKRKYPLIIL